MYTFLIVMGISAYLSIVLSFLTGMRYIKIKYKTHKKIGIFGFVTGTIHALFMIYFNLLS